MSIVHDTLAPYLLLSSGLRDIANQQFLVLAQKDFCCCFFILVIAARNILGANLGQQQVLPWHLCCSESGEIEDEITDLIQHIQRVHCLENKGRVCYAATENKVCILCVVL